VAEHHYSVLLRPGAKRDLASLPLAARRKISRAIDDLASEPRPRGAKLLAGTRDERIWRLRVGDHRVLYEIRNDELVILVIRIGHRREIYRRRTGG
jgi:mRNA interferase RelE/StbE